MSKNTFNFINFKNAEYSFDRVYFYESFIGSTFYFLHIYE